MDFGNRSVSEDRVVATGILQVDLDIFDYLRQVEMSQPILQIDSLPDSSIGLKLKSIP